MNHRTTGALAGVLFGLLISSNAVAEPGASAAPPPGLNPEKPSLAVNAGLIQPLLLGGANVEVDFRFRHFVASYSHGWSLNIRDAAVVGAMREQGISLHLPYSTGLGVGYTLFVESIRSFFDLRVEGKIHRFEASYASADGTQKTSVAGYSTYTLGGGLYWTYVPFARRDDALRGVNISTSVRVWPRLGSSLPGNQVSYANATTGRNEVHQAANIGMLNTPAFVNVSLGYVFQ